MPGDDSGQPDREAPHLLAISPAPGSSAWLHEPIRYTFDEPIGAPALTVTATLGGESVEAIAAVDLDPHSLVISLAAGARGIGPHQRDDQLSLADAVVRAETLGASDDVRRLIGGGGWIVHARGLIRSRRIIDHRLRISGRGRLCRRILASRLLARRILLGRLFVGQRIARRRIFDRRRVDRADRHRNQGCKEAAVSRRGMLFFVLEGTLLLDLEGRTVALTPRQSMAVPRGVVHRTPTPDRAVMLMVEPASVVPTGD